MSAVAQDPALQLAALEAAGVERLYTDHLPGNAAERPGLERALDALRPGDTLAAGGWTPWALGRPAAAARRRPAPTRHGTALANRRQRYPRACGEAYFTIMAAMAQMERRLNSGRTKAGIAVARRRGRRNFFDSQANIRAANSLLREGSLAKVDIAKRLGISTDALNRRIPGGRPDPLPGAGGEAAA